MQELRMQIITPESDPNHPFWKLDWGQLFGPDSTFDEEDALYRCAGEDYFDVMSCLLDHPNVKEVCVIRPKLPEEGEYVFLGPDSRLGYLCESLVSLEEYIPEELGERAELSLDAAIADNMRQQRRQQEPQCYCDLHRGHSTDCQWKVWKDSQEEE